MTFLQLLRRVFSFGSRARQRRRERIATALLAGICANPGPWNDFLNGSPAAAAVAGADALIAELDKEGGQR